MELWAHAIQLHTASQKEERERCFAWAWSVTRAALSRTPAKLFWASRLFQWSVLQPGKSLHTASPFSLPSSFRLKVKSFTKINISTTLGGIGDEKNQVSPPCLIWCSDYHTHNKKKHEAEHKTVPNQIVHRDATLWFGLKQFKAKTLVWHEGPSWALSWFSGRIY